MKQAEPPSRLVRFEGFVLDLHTGELRPNGGPALAIAEQPFRILAILVSRPGELVTREEIRNALWPDGTVVEFEHSISAAMKRLRQALGDPVEAPRFIETLPRRGYRWKALVERVEATHASPRSQIVPPFREDSAVSNLIGKRVSHYRVLGVIGGGGMGVVYKAEDLKLGRHVALKFLPEELAADRSTLQRFEREARLASSLNHPNICSVYEFGEHEGQPFIAMELLEGDTVRELMSTAVLVSGGRPHLALGKLLDVGIQVAAGLDAAHQKGIIHRDIKPANIFVTIRGEVKILDFGLAKTTATFTELAVDQIREEVANGPPPQNLAASPIEHSLSHTGIAMGTAGYMSPEQVLGEKLDARTDLFSFGLILFEMATGQRAFSGDTAVILKDAILNHRVPPARELNPELPLPLEQIINNALQKDRELRYQTASELRADLKSVAAGLHIESGHPKLNRTSAAWLMPITFALLLIAASVLWLLGIRPHPSQGLPDVTQRQLTTNSSENPVSGGSISPDGRYLAYADLKGIHIKFIETGETQNVPQPDVLKGTQVNWGIATNWVRDGSSFIANSNVPGKPPSIWAIPAWGGTPRKLRDDAYSWAVSRDGSWVAFTTNPGRVLYREMWRMRPDGEQAAKLYEGGENDGFFGADWAPDGQRLSYIARHQRPDTSEDNIESRDLKGGPAVIARPGGVADWTWSPDGRLIYILPEESPLEESCNFWDIHVDARTGKPRTSPARLTNWAGFCVQDPTVTADGKRLAFRKFAPQGTIYVADFQGGGTRLSGARRLTLNEGESYLAGWTADSKAVVFESYRDGQWSIFKQSPDEDAAEPVVTGAKDGGGTFATVSPDGIWLFYVAPAREHGSSSTSATDKLMRMPISGSEPELVLEGHLYGKPACAASVAKRCVIAEASADQRQLVFSVFDPEKGRGGELTRFEIDSTTGSRYLWDLSPDGRRIAILKYSDGFIELLSLDGHAPEKIVVKGWNSLLSLNWDSSGKSIFASSQTKTGSVLLRVNLKGEAQVLWEQNGSIAPWNRPFASDHSAPEAIPSPDGRRLAIYSWNMSSNMWMMENF